MEYSSTIEDSKHDVVYQLLCMGCLCGGRTTKTLTDPALMKYFKDILIDAQVSFSVSVPTPRLCWECEALLKRTFHFTKQVRDCFVILQKSLFMLNSKESAIDFAKKLIHTSHIQCSVVELIYIPSNEGLAPSDTGTEAHVYEVPLLATVKQEVQGYDNKNIEVPLDVTVKEEIMEDTPPSEVETFKRRTYIFHDTAAVTSEYTCESSNNVVCVNNEMLKVKKKQGIKTYVCDGCNNGFTSRAQLKQHITSSNIYPHVNTGCHKKKKNRYQCATCLKAFPTNYYLIKHIRIHTGEKPYQCEVCQKWFTRKEGLKDHMRLHTGNKPYNCTICQKGFTRGGDLRKHTRTHTGEKPYKCNLCQKGFARSESLKVHTKTHTGERPYTCSICQKGCVHRGDLKVHMRIHTGEKPFKCPVCHKGFTRSPSLKYHMKIHE